MGTTDADCTPASNWCFHDMTLSDDGEINGFNGFEFTSILTRENFDSHFMLKSLNKLVQNLMISSYKESTTKAAFFNLVKFIPSRSKVDYVYKR